MHPMTVHEAVERNFAKWAYLRIVPISGGVRVSAIHTRATLPRGKG